MAMEGMVVIAVLGLMAASVIAAVVKGKKGNKESGCTGCPNYNTCRAHLGCSNNTSKRSK